MSTTITTPNNARARRPARSGTTQPPDPIQVETIDRQPAARTGGPKTVEGKAVAARNATFHGIYSAVPVIPGVETDEQWTVHRLGVAATLNPQGQLEEILVERIAALLWRLRRVLRYETNAAATAQEEAPADAAARHPLPPSPPHRQPPQPSHAGFFPPFDPQRRQVLAFLTLLPQLEDASPISAGDVSFALPSVANVAHQRHVQVERLGLPGLPARTPLFSVAGWTAAHFRRCVEHLAAATGQQPQALIDSTLDALRALLPPEAAPPPPPDDSDPAVVRLRRQRLLPPSEVLDRVMRYEAHLNRQLAAALRQLDALQSRRLCYPASPRLPFSPD